MITGAYSTINLQSALSAANPPTDPPPTPHHPLMCRDELLWLDEDGTFGCAHAQVDPGDRRTRGAIDQSIAILLLELVAEREAS